VAAVSTRLVSLGALIAVTLIATCTAAVGSTATTVVSPRWAGYVATRLAAAPSVFTGAVGTWKHPRPSCTRGDHSSAAAIWVGIGGYDGSTQVLQQIGTTAGCDSRGKPVNTAWFAVLPYPAHNILLKVNPGDTLTGVVTVLPTATRLQLVNRTRKWAFVRTITAGAPDTTSAEWIVEPPMNCVRRTCRQAELTNFDSVTFSEISLVADGQAGTLSTSASTVTAIELGRVSSTRRPSRATATPGPIDVHGASFTITWSASAHTEQD
jgi:hypothetical protein